MTSFREEDVRSGAYSSVGRQRVLINFATGINPRLAALERERAAALALKDNAGAAVLLAAPRAQMKADNGAVAPLQADALLFTDREYRLATLPAQFAGRDFIRASIDRGATAVCAAPGVVYVLTPAPERNRDSVEAALLAQGFVKAAVPEFVLFGGSAANACSVYQKTLQSGEKITIGKWGVIVF